MKRFTALAQAIFFAVVTTVTAQISSFPAEPPDVDGYTYISTVAELNAVRLNLGGNYVLVNDIDLSEYGKWTPIGTESSPFLGTFDGSGKIVKGVTVDVGNAAPGLFGVNGDVGIIKNLKVVYASRFGGVAGINNGTTENSIADFEFTPAVTYTNLNVPATITENFVRIDLTNADFNRSITVSNSVEVIMFEGISGRTLTGTITIEGNTDVVLKNITINGGTNRVLHFTGDNPSLISVGGMGGNKLTIGSAEITGGVDASGNLYICGTADLDIEHNTVAELNGGSAMSVGQTLTIALDAKLTVSGADGADGADGTAGRNAPVNAIVGSSAASGDGGGQAGNGGNGGNGISVNKINIINKSQVYLYGVRWSPFFDSFRSVFKVSSRYI